MSYAYLLAGEYLELAEAELEGFLRSQKIDEKVERTGRLAKTGTEPDQVKRLALTHEVARIKQESDSVDFDPSYRPENSYAVRVENLADRSIDEKQLESEFGQKISTESNEVDLENPDQIVKLYLLEDSVVLGVLVQDIDRGLYNKRKNQERPFSSPVSLDPILARVMVNLSELPHGEYILDPFCGTGGILIEAGLCGIGVKGLDISEEMVEGSRENLEEYGIIAHDIRQGSIENLSNNFSGEYGAIVTDLPYGKSSKEFEKPVEEFLKVIESLEDKKIVFMYNEPDLGGYKHDFEVYVHKNLTRYIYVL
jgi:tRNA (guanine10-N2)-dimethyltransferase